MGQTNQFSGGKKHYKAIRPNERPNGYSAMITREEEARVMAGSVASDHSSEIIFGEVTCNYSNVKSVVGSKNLRNTGLKVWEHFTICNAGNIVA